MSRWEFKQIKPQKARGSLKFVDTDDWVVEEKYDGDRRIAQFCFDAVRFTGTRESVNGGGFVEKTANLPHLARPVPYLEGTVLDGEIICEREGARSKDVASVMGSASEVAIAKQAERGWLTYVMFDCLFYRGTDIRHQPLRMRRGALLRAVNAWQRDVVPSVQGDDNYPLRVCDHLRIAPQNPSTDAQKLFQTIIETGGEGLVYKDLRAPYGNERAWVKRKREATYDVVITGFEPGKGKYLGQVGAIKFGQYRDGWLAPCGQCSGMDDALRAALSAEPDRYLMKVMEIKANAREESGKFRHPQFSRLRFDKSLRDCIFNKEEL